MAGLVVVGLALWAILWSAERPRARYDTLWYSAFAYQDAGVGVQDSWLRSYDLTIEYSNPGVASTIHRDANGAWFSGWDDPRRQRWVGIYRMRPLMPVLAAAAYPVLGTQAPIVAGVVAVVVVALVAGLVLPTLAGWQVAALVLLFTAANPVVGRWLVFLMPDGLGIAFWFATLALVAGYVRTGGRRWLAGAAVATLLLAFSRPSAVAIPLIMAICALASVVSRNGPWRRFAAATAVTLVPVLVFTAWAAAAGMPSFADQLQDLPTLHFVRADVSRRALLAFFEQHDLAIARDLLVSLPAQPAVWLSLIGAVVGFALARRWWTAPFVVAIAVVPLLVLVHPESTEVARTLTPAWLSVNVGLALAAMAGIAWIRRRTGYDSQPPTEATPG